VKKRLEGMTEVELRELMTAMGNQIKVVSAVMEVEPPLFVLVLFNDPALGQYISNCRREDVVKAMRETADRLERREDVTR
jgi:hypothetical protein